MADNGLLIGIDFGTGSSKGVLVRPNGEMVAQEALEHRTSNPCSQRQQHNIAVALCCALPNFTQQRRMSIVQYKHGIR